MPGVYPGSSPGVQNRPLYLQKSPYYRRTRVDKCSILLSTTHFHEMKVIIMHIHQNMTKKYVKIGLNSPKSSNIGFFCSKSRKLTGQMCTTWVKWIRMSRVPWNTTNPCIQMVLTFCIYTFKSKFHPEDVDFSKKPFGSGFFKILSTFRI